MSEMPPGTIGFQATGEVTADDYRQVLEPGLREAAESGEIRLLYRFGEEVKMDLGAMAQDAKTGLGLGLGHHSAWKKTAVVTDTEWIERAMHMFAWMAPGECRIFSGDQVEEAKSWLAA